MDISISVRHGELLPASQDYIEKKLPKLTHLFERIMEIRVTVDLGGSEPEVEINVEAEHRKDFVAKERHGSVEAAFDLVMGKMEEQLRRYKEKIQDHHKH